MKLEKNWIVIVLDQYQFLNHHLRVEAVQITKVLPMVPLHSFWCHVKFFSVMCMVLALELMKNAIREGLGTQWS